MGFFEKISRSPGEKRVAAHFEKLDRRTNAEIGPNKALLPQVKSLSLNLFQMSMVSDSNWRETVNALSSLKEVARKANSVEDLKLATSLHSVAYMRDILNLEHGHPRMSTFQNLKFHWYELFEDLVDLYLVGKYINLQPSEIGEVLDFLNFLDRRILSEFEGTPELAQWIEARRFHRHEYPALLDLENL